MRSVARLVHLGASLLALLLHLWALFAEYPVFVENTRLMDDPAAYGERAG
jgi:hypothetical protein